VILAQSPDLTIIELARTVVDIYCDYCSKCVKMRSCTQLEYALGAKELELLYFASVSAGIENTQHSSAERGSGVGVTYNVCLEQNVYWFCWKITHQLHSVEKMQVTFKPFKNYSQVAPPPSP